ncbi:chromosome partitioning protein [Salirhabdus euzebyi]|uniref:Chromosome partitioning protein n=1 Tax=Salirhabdus euzebyi TaxID=394506 RepID=A0A841PZ66_9BACI|nr:AAA family ATPase [Salirhabdus euzebyi]MBB6452571.1 chromosome partitioning protein [Salirhabdus euzebyi]
MNVISVINYKGGVGKTTLSANIAAEYAKQGKKVLLIDLDPQTNLTLSLIKMEEWQNYDNQGRTIKHWYDEFLDSDRDSDIGDLIITPSKVNNHLGMLEGQIDLVCSHLELINVDMELSSRLGGNSERTIRRNYLKVLSRLKKNLDTIKDNYDMVIIDCPPNFNVVTQNALVASDYYIIPAKADYLSTLGINTLLGHVKELENKFNRYCAKSRNVKMAPISPKMLGVVFTMVTIRNGEPIAIQKEYIDQVIRNQEQHCFKTTLRENKTLYSKAPETGIPVVLSPKNLQQEKASDEIQGIVKELTSFLTELTPVDGGGTYV